MRAFGSFTFDEVEKMFQIKEVETLNLLSDWLATTTENIDAAVYQLLEKARKHLLKKANIWNEDELKMFFIGHLIEMAEISTDDFQPFTQRMLSFKYQEEEVSGRVDFLIAKGRRIPESPYFCVHEYKQETNTSEDPLGQLLIAMVAAQKLNGTDIPILGSYIIGRNWFFVVLIGNEYAKSDAYVATSNDIFQIFSILKKSKEIIAQYV